MSGTGRPAPLPATLSIKSLRNAISACRACDLYKHATQPVFGEGPARSKIVFVGEQPGNEEDLAGHPFVGPSGRLLRTTLHEAGIDPRDVYITNAVKHFKFVMRGKRRIHAKPKVIELDSCMPWLRSELAVVRPRLVVALGATAAQAFLGPAFRLTKHRGEILSCELAPRILATVHPSSILRAPDAEIRRLELRGFLEGSAARRRPTLGRRHLHGRGWDSNPRNAHHVLRFSRPPHSTALPPLRVCASPHFMRVCAALTDLSKSPNPPVVAVWIHLVDSITAAEFLIAMQRCNRPVSGTIAEISLDTFSRRLQAVLSCLTLGLRSYLSRTSSISRWRITVCGRPRTATS